MRLRNNSNFIKILLIVIVLIGACKNQENIKIIQQSNKIEGILNEKEAQNNNCKFVFKQLIYSSSLKNPFIDSLDISIDEKDDGKILICRNF